MTCTKEYREHIEYTFHAFCIVVIRKAIQQLYEEMERVAHEE